jgi:hypothetical protein
MIYEKTLANLSRVKNEWPEKFNQPPTLKLYSG